MPATYDADAIVIAGTAAIFVAPVGTTMPTSPSAPLAAAFLSLGYTTEDGVQFNDEKTINGVRPHQSFYQVRRWIEARDANAVFSMLEWDRKTVELAFGGGAWTEPTPGEFRYDPPSPETIDERSLVIDIDDGAIRYRIGIPKGMVSSNTQSTFARTGPALLPITFGVLGEDGITPWYILTDSPAASTAGAGS